VLVAVIYAIKAELQCFHIRVLPHGSFPAVFVANFYQETERNGKLIYQRGNVSLKLNSAILYVER
jgi:hypothetical protein